MPQFPRVLYHAARRQYADNRVWTKQALASKRIRQVIRLIALEETLQMYGMGALPPSVMTTLRLLSDYKEMHRKTVFHYRYVPRSLPCDIPFDDLEMVCGHPSPNAPVIAATKQGDRLFDDGESLRGFFCSAWCAKNRGNRVMAVLVFDPSETVKPEKQMRLG